MPERPPRESEPVDAIYDDPSLVALYDILNESDHDHVFYQQEIGPRSKRIVDLGCGTGRFAIDLARRGHTVVALDPAPSMIDYARKQDKTGGIRWILGTAADIPEGIGADAVTMTGHAFQCLLTDDDIRETFRAVRSALHAGGRFLFESRNPAIAPWSNWNVREVIRPGVSENAVTVERRVLAVNVDSVTFEETFVLPGRTVTSRSSLRFLDKDAIADHLRAAGFEDIIVFGFWDGRPFSADSPEMIFSAA